VCFIVMKIHHICQRRHSKQISQSLVSYPIHFQFQNVLGLLLFEKGEGGVKKILSTDSVYRKFAGQNVKVLHHHCIGKCWFPYTTSIICGPKVHMSGCCGLSPPN